MVEASGKPCGQGRRLSSGRREELRPEVAIFKRLLERRGSCGVWEFSVFLPQTLGRGGCGGGRDSNEEGFVLGDGGEIQASPHS